MDEKTNKNKFNIRKLKRFTGCCVVLLVIFLGLFGTVAALTATGHTKKWVCNVVIEDSYIWDKINCDSSSSSQTGDLTQEQQIRFDELTKQLQDNPENRISTIVQAVQPSVVGVGIQGQTVNQNGIVGTGFVIEKGMIATNQHVVSSKTATYFIQVNGADSTMEVTKIHRDSVNDIAIIEFNDTEGLVPLVLGDSSKLKVGQEVIAIGNPLGDLAGTVTSGIISGLNRSVSVGNGGFFNSTVSTFEDVIQTDAAINPGNSGGPLIDMSGGVIGINFATVGGADNLSFALPINRIKQRIEELKQYSEFRMPYLGVEYRNRVAFVNQQAVIAAEVLDIANDSPADKAGLELGDLIVGYNGKDFSDQGLLDLIQSSDIGEKIKLNVLRDAEQIEITVEIGVQGN